MVDSTGVFDVERVRHRKRTNQNLIFQDLTPKFFSSYGLLEIHHNLYERLPSLDYKTLPTRKLLSRTNCRHELVRAKYSTDKSVPTIFEQLSIGNGIIVYKDNLLKIVYVPIFSIVKELLE